MLSKKDSPKAFTSIRIISKKAQKMIDRAKRNLATDEKSESKTPVPSRKKSIQQVKVDVSLRSVTRATFAILGIVLLFWLLFHLRHKILLMLLAGFVATVVDPGVNKLQRFGVPRGLAIISQYILALSLILFLVLSLIPIIAEQLQEIANSVGTDLGPFLTNPRVEIPFVSADVNLRLTQLTQQLLSQSSLDTFVVSLREAGRDLSNIAQQSVVFAAKLAGSAVNFVVSLVVVLVLAFFMQMEKEKIVSWVRSFLPHEFRKYADLKSEAIHTKIGQWMVGELLLMFSIFALTLIAMVILKMPYALTLAVLAGFCEFIPAIGPLFAALPAILIAGTQKGIFWIPVIGGVFYVIQWCENNLLVPLIMKRAVGLSPIAILFAMMVGISFPDTVHPILGVMLAVPTTTILALFLEDWRDKK